MDDEVYYSRRFPKWTEKFRYILYFLCFAVVFYFFNHFILRVYYLEDSYCKEVPAKSYVVATFYHPFWGVLPKEGDLVFVDVLALPKISVATLLELLSLGILKADSWREPVAVGQRLYRIIALPGDKINFENYNQLQVKNEGKAQVKVYQLPENSPSFFSLFQKSELILPQGEYLAYLSGTNSLNAVHTFCLIKLKDIVAQVRFYF